MLFLPYSVSCNWDRTIRSAIIKNENSFEKFFHSVRVKNVCKNIMSTKICTKQIWQYRFADCILNAVPFLSETFTNCKLYRDDIKCVGLRIQHITSVYFFSTIKRKRQEKRKKNKCDSLLLREMRNFKCVMSSVCVCVLVSFYQILFCCLLFNRFVWGTFFSTMKELDKWVNGELVEEKIFRNKV